MSAGRYYREKWTSEVATLIAERGVPPWVRRLTLPAYKVRDAARYADISGQTIRNWEASAWPSGNILSKREDGAALSYLQLVEIAFVAALRKTGAKLPAIKDARDFIAMQLGCEYPFAQKRFKTDGRDILMAYSEFVAGQPEEKLLVANKGGQLAWATILETKFTEFDYEDELAVRWHPQGKQSPVFIDPRISFGAPIVGGIATWAIRGRYDAGESLEDIAQDFGISEREVETALKFEGIDLSELKAWH